jgi:ribonuclease D
MNDKLDPAPIFPKAQYPGSIVTVVKDSDISPALDLIRGERLVGFDTETKPSFKKGEFYHVSLLQLATDNHALLFRLHHLKDFSLLKIFFEDSSIIKAGVAIHDDIKALQKLFPFSPHGFIELAEIAKQKNLKNFGLKGMTEEVLQLTLSKKAKLSNWEASDLKSEQLHYAASDAWIGKKLYEALK